MAKKAARNLETSVRLEPAEPSPPGATAAAEQQADDELRLSDDEEGA